MTLCVAFRSSSSTTVKHGVSVELTFYFKACAHKVPRFNELVQNSLHVYRINQSLMELAVPLAKTVECFIWFIGKVQGFPQSGETMNALPIYSVIKAWVGSGVLLRQMRLTHLRSLPYLLCDFQSVNSAPCTFYGPNNPHHPYPVLATLRTLLGLGQAYWEVP